ncbi:MAG: ribosome-associated translation inhibitor RaiA [Deltaproteobacteria bacterium]|nr:ribosome-associated translation inhibitor RaiA [Deltaproteobacteria bacterium]
MKENFKIQLTFRHHLRKSLAIEKYLREKLKALQKNCNQVEAVNCVFNVEKKEHSACITLYGRNMKFYAEGVSPDMYSSIDLALSKLGNQVQKIKEAK